MLHTPPTLAPSAAKPHFVCEPAAKHTFNSAGGCRYLLKLMTGDKLPTSEAAFGEQLRLYFPRVWDMKYIMGKKNIHGGLSKVCAWRLKLPLCTLRPNASGYVGALYGCGGAPWPSLCG